MDQKLKNRFQEHAKDYDSIIDRVCPFYRQMITELTDALTEKMVFILEYGCGTGEITRAILEAQKKANITALDISDRMIAKAGEKCLEFEDRVTFIETDFTRYRTSRKYDAAVSSLAFHHLSEKDAEYTYDNLHAQLESGGILFVLDTFIEKDRYLAKRNHDYRIRMMQEKGLDEDFISEAERKRKDVNKRRAVLREVELIKKAGFASIDIISKQKETALIMAKKW